MEQTQKKTGIHSPIESNSVCRTLYILRRKQLKLDSRGLPAVFPASVGFMYLL